MPWLVCSGHVHVKLRSVQFQQYQYQLLNFWYCGIGVGVLSLYTGLHRCRRSSSLQERTGKTLDVMTFPFEIFSSLPPARWCMTSLTLIYMFSVSVPPKKNPTKMTENSQIAFLEAQFVSFVHDTHLDFTWQGLLKNVFTMSFQQSILFILSLMTNVLASLTDTLDLEKSQKSYTPLP